MPAAARPVPGLVVDVAQRRARLARRHGLVVPFDDAPTASRQLVALHGTDASGPYVASWARVPGFTTSDLDAALFEDRTLVRHLAMRRTLWVADAALLPALVAGPGARVAGQERRRLVKELDLDPAGDGDGEAWLDAAAARVVAHLADGRPRTATELRAELPELGRTVVAGPGTRWSTTMPALPRVLTYLAARGVLLRGPNRGGWTSSRPAWTLPETWLGAPVAQVDADAAHDELVGRWLRAFGPGTERDVTWWLGSTLTAVRRSLVTLGAVPVLLPPEVPTVGAGGAGGPGASGDAGEIGYLLPDDLDPVPDVGPWVALLPGLDPTTMGWAGRDWYLGPHASEVVDSVGNAGPTAWVDGRVVGAWAAATGVVELALLEDVGRRARAAIDAEVARLTAWLAGGRVAPSFPSPLFGGRRAAGTVGRTG
ncbi:winged helix DNA-binding domain-containing protein [Cellulomonas sp. DKR-3]|uniref:Winged helix DNA-binding domain-containing protein n=1 Tax=Cellulomonas fulva TaxID=2835530 RepID=A0ABS5TY48_9CELL|nr:winged helix DNA-binding domain-containing protein [Cellulomonas fulva]MBT0994079.1 winged helix DNA-binding domain-containing protein [Cellulomonas fulva]